jgi:ribose 5-phosphate isomerase A
MTKLENLKEQAAQASLKYIKDNFTIGLGTGSTVKYALEGIASLIKSGSLKNIRGIATSKSTLEVASMYGIDLVTFSESPQLDLYIDGADEVDDNFDLIKGGGAALIREKIVAQNAKLKIIIVDSSKLSRRIGERWAVPIEVMPFALGTEIGFLKTLNSVCQLRKSADGSPLLTENGNYILDTNFGEITDSKKLSQSLDARAGIIGHGIFHNLTDILIAASDVGVSELKKGEKGKFVNLLKAIKFMQSN